MKIAILGHSGSGKSTMAKTLGNLYHVPVLHLDTVKFLPGWVEREDDEARDIVAEFLNHDQWVIDGNYTTYYQAERLEAADQIILFDFPRHICFYRGLKRYFKHRKQTRPDMAAGCLEKFDAEFAWWILHEGRTQARLNHFNDISQKYHHKLIVLKNPKQVEAFLASLNEKPA
ncbi:MAG TPA: DNA topology modulation protein FlaR [Firmicutes bacterium]|nr:DNA topology modulation protein FlaR [Bacillota bacterium]